MRCQFCNGTGRELDQNNHPTHVDCIECEGTGKQPYEIGEEEIVDTMHLERQSSDDEYDDWYDSNIY